ncbi:hypothetical protein I2I05_20875 [Hymenobacter sp. BT683]|uniref:Uncharacterized protein n=1 Tax=Hymenobacter jeongseonensis TaxID=2791027 RepID=A0ABS0INB0_9BACT|nr:Imm50 family immunity protein [Hymenobacter jeongseonensis]MBF9239859.1 hypothetical protein [Hymenobacter jeongseonensis]
MLQTLLHTSKMVTSIYGTEELVWPGGTLRKVNFDNAPYPSLGVGVEPANFPAKPPAKWQTAGFNTCILGFQFTEVTALTLTTLGEFRLVDIVSERIGALYRVTFEGEGTALLRIDARYVDVSSINAYLNGYS